MKREFQSSSKSARVVSALIAILATTLLAGSIEFLIQHYESGPHVAQAPAPVVSAG
jgi:hypothetical protein